MGQGRQALPSVSTRARAAGRSCDGYRAQPVVRQCRALPPRGGCGAPRQPARPEECSRLFPSIHASQFHCHLQQGCLDHGAHDRRRWQYGDSAFPRGRGPARSLQADLVPGPRTARTSCRQHRVGLDRRTPRYVGRRAHRRQCRGRRHARVSAPSSMDFFSWAR